MVSVNTKVASVTALAVAIAEGRDPDSLELLGAIFTQLGDTLTTISIARAIEEKQPPVNNQASEKPAAKTPVT